MGLKASGDHARSPTRIPLSELPPRDWAAAARALDEDGAAHLPGALTADGLARVEAGVDAALASPSGHAKRFYPKEAATFHEDTGHRLLAVVREAGIDTTLAALWGLTDFWYLGEQLFLKEGGHARRTPWHQDTSYLRMMGSQLVACWISLDPLPKRHCLEFVRGSHRGTLYNGSAFAEGDDTAPLYRHSLLPRLPDIEADRSGWDIVSWDVEPGDLIFFHLGVLHGGAGTEPGMRRRTVSLRFLGPDVVYDGRPRDERGRRKATTWRFPACIRASGTATRSAPACWRRSETTAVRPRSCAPLRQRKKRLDPAPGTNWKHDRVEDRYLLVSQPPRFFSPVETARRLKVSTKALRLYETLGLVNPVRTSTGWRTYGPDQMVRLHQVLALKHLGLPLKRVGELLGDQLADLDAVLLLQETAFRARIADDARRLELLVAVRRRLAGGENLSVDDLIHLTRETVMTDPIEGRLATVHLRVDDGRRATAYFGELFGWKFTEEPRDGLRWSRAAAGIGDHPWALAITEDPSAPRVRLGFEVADPAEALARARSLGGAGRSPEAAVDDQGLPLAFCAGAPRPQVSGRATGELGVAVALVDDTAKAKAFYEALFGDGFHQIGPQDRWWSSRAAFGLFSNTLGQAYPARVEAGGAPEVHVFVCVRDLAEHKSRVRALGGSVLAENSMGPYEVCACLDDQGTRFHLWRDPARVG